MLFTLKTKKAVKYLAVVAALTTVWGCEQAQQAKTEPANNAQSVPANVSEQQPLQAQHLAPYLTRDIQDEVFYFVMPDRFYNGNTDNDHGSKTKPISAGGLDKTNKGMYHGGDIQGLTEKLPYLKSLGISSIWLTPILRNRAMQDDSSGYHGYWVLDFTEIDPHLGSNDNLKTLIAKAHQENIKIFFDIITNHTADVIKYVECHGEDGQQWLIDSKDGCPYKSLAQVRDGDSYQTVIPTGQESLKIPQWLNDPKYYHNQGDSTFKGENSLYGDFAGLDDINTDDPAVVSGMIDIFKSLISEFKPDGFRIDTVKHVNTEFWAKFSPALVEHAKSIGIPKFFMFGEVYDANSKVLSKYTTEGKMQSVLDFGFQSAVYDVLINQKGTQLLADLFARDVDYLDDDSNANQLLNFVGNHDMGRFAYMVNTSDFNYDQSAQISRNLLAHAMAYFMRGVPIVYYGAEQGFVGDGGDRDSRQDMMPSLVASYNDDNLLATDATTADDNFDTSHLFYRTFAQYADIYFRHDALRHGQHKTLYAQEKPGVFALSRTITNSQQDVVVVFNTAETPQKVSFPVASANYKTIYEAQQKDANMEISNKEMTISIAPLSFSIYQAK